MEWMEDERVAGWLTAVLGEARGSPLRVEGSQAGGDPERVGVVCVGPGLPTAVKQALPGLSPIWVTAWSCEACRAQEGGRMARSVGRRPPPLSCREGSHRSVSS